MSRDIPSALALDLQSQASTHALLAFMTITHRNLATPIRVVSDPLDFEVDGQVFLGCPFEFQLLNDDENAPMTQVRVQNVDRRIGEAIRTVPDRARVMLEVRSTADFDLSVTPRSEVGTSSVVYGFRHFDLIDVTVNAVEVTGTLMLRDYSQEPWPGRRATQSRCPALFR